MFARVGCRDFEKIAACIVKRLALGLVAFAFLPAAADQRWYWSETGSLRLGPSQTSPVRSVVHKGAWMTLQHCINEGANDAWCFGEVYGHDEGWVLRHILTENDPDLDVEQNSNSSGLGGNETRQRRYHLQDRRRFYGLISNTFSWGTANAESSSRTFSGLGAWTLRAALGWHWGHRPLHRWGSEVSFGHERISLTSTDGDESLSATQLVAGLSVVRMAPYSHTWGLGWRARLSLPLSRSFSEALEKEPSSFLFAIGPVWSHGVPASMPKPEWMEWELMLKLGISQWQILFGSNFVF